MAKKKKAVKKKAARKKPRGGAREGAGRKPLVSGGVQKKSFSLFPKHLRFIERERKRRGLAYASDALRQLLDESEGS